MTRISLSFETLQLYLSLNINHLFEEFSALTSRRLTVLAGAAGPGAGPFERVTAAQQGDDEDSRDTLISAITAQFFTGPMAGDTLSMSLR